MIDRVRLSAAAIGLFAFALWLGFVVTAGDLSGFDISVSRIFNLHRGVSSDWIIAAAQFISWIGGGVQRYIMVTLLSLGLWRFWGLRAGLVMALTSLLSSFASDIFKIYFGRLRPELVPHLENITSYAYTSGHATNAAAVYLLFILLMPGGARTAWKILALFLTIATGLSRVMLGVHWPSDVIGGWMLGSAFALGAYNLICSVDNRRAGHHTLLAK